MPEEGENYTLVSLALQIRSAHGVGVGVPAERFYTDRQERAVQVDVAG